MSSGELEQLVLRFRALAKDFNFDVLVSGEDFLRSCKEGLNKE